MLNLLIDNFINFIGGAIKMAKCMICEKTLAHGNKISIARSHVSQRD